MLFVPRAIKGRDAMRIRVIGFDPARDEAVFPARLLAHRRCRAGERPTRSCSSTGVSRILGVAKGDTIVLEARTAAGAMNALEVKVTGVLTTTNPILDQLGAFAPMALVDSLVQPEGKWSHLAVRLGDRADADAVAAELRTRLERRARHDVRAGSGGSVVRAGAATAHVRHPRTRAHGDLGDGDREHRADGDLRTGARDRDAPGARHDAAVARGAVRDRGARCSASSARPLGAGLGAATVHHYSVQGIDLSSMIAKASENGGYENVSFSTMLYLDWSIPTALAAFAFGLAVAVLASLYPAVFASRLSPAESVRA